MLRQVRYMLFAVVLYVAGIALAIPIARFDMPILSAFLRGMLTGLGL